MIEDMVQRLMDLADSPKRRDRVIAGIWFIAIAPAMVLLAPLFCLAYGAILLFKKKPLL